MGEGFPSNSETFKDGRSTDWTDNEMLGLGGGSSISPEGVLYADSSSEYEGPSIGWETEAWVDEKVKEGIVPLVLVRRTDADADVETVLETVAGGGVMTRAARSSWSGRAPSEATLRSSCIEFDCSAVVLLASASLNISLE